MTQPIPRQGQGKPIRADELRSGDQVLLLGRLVDIVDMQTAREFLRAVNLVILPDGGQPRETLVPRDMLLLGMKLPRVDRLDCSGCPAVIRVHVDAAAGVIERPLCADCRNRKGGAGSPWLTPSQGLLMANDVQRALAASPSAERDRWFNREILRHGVRGQITCWRSGVVLDIDSAVMVTVVQVGMSRSMVFDGAAFDEVEEALRAKADARNVRLEVIDGRTL